MRFWTKPLQDQITVDILLFDQFSNHCLANCLEPLRAANDLAGQRIYQWRFFTLDGAPVQSSSGLPVLPEHALGAAQNGEYLYVISSYHFRKFDTVATKRALQGAAKRSKNIMGLDTGSWLMASAGLLDGCAATIHWDIFDSFSETFLNVNAKKERFILDDNRGTCGGAMAAFDMALALISKLNGEALKLDVATLFMHDTPSEFGRSLVIHRAIVRNAVHIMREHLETPITIAQIAHALGCHEKHLQREFVADLGAPPGKIYRYIRLSAARDLVVSTQLAVSEIAVRVGYENASAMARAFKSRFGLSPENFRKK
ncbi:GlxA family transcriptional regulator [Paramylibacter ulvae]|uniref:GlxA family transcriptional regulator n=1 Tax=Paramylibacter ulvae TaxID=1651968 RepID=UPI001671FF19|nr:helix-turn-helix domain-containing protein [Amylibacter ulvae]